MNVLGERRGHNVWHAENSTTRWRSRNRNEGNRSDVDDLLSKWWTSVDSAQTENETETENSIERTARTPKRKNRPAAARSARGAISADSESAFDPNSIANQIKERKDFGNLQQKILHKKDSYNKIALILWISDTPLTSGQIHRVLEALDVRMGLPQVSKGLRANISKFLTSAKRQAGGPPATYRLSAQAKADFEARLRQDG